MKIKTYKLADLTEFEGNYNKHSETQIEHLKRSLTDFSQVKNVVIWKNQIVCGNGLVMAAKELGWQEINALDVSHLTKKQAKALLIADNKTAEMSEPDNAMLLELLNDFDNPFEEVPGIVKKESSAFNRFNNDAEEIDFCMDEKNVLSIALEKELCHKWEFLKKEHKIKTDTKMLIYLLNKE